MNESLYLLEINALGILQLVLDNNTFWPTNLIIKNYLCFNQKITSMEYEIWGIDLDVIQATDNWKFHY